MAVKKKEKEAPAGAPEWMVTYGDMVTLLLTFFVLLLAMSEVKKDETFIDFMQAIRESFGYIGGVKMVPIEEVQIPRNVDLTDMLIIPVDPEDFSKSKEKGVKGRDERVTDLRREDQIITGGKILFEPLSAEISAAGHEQLVDVASKLRGHLTQIKVRGHCSRRPVEGSGFADFYELSFERARAVAKVLTAEGIEPDRLLVIAAATYEPFTNRAYTAPELRENDVVELLQVDLRVDVFSENAMTPDEIRAKNAADALLNPTPTATDDATPSDDNAEVTPGDPAPAVPQ